MIDAQLVLLALLSTTIGALILGVWTGKAIWGRPTVIRIRESADQAPTRYVLVPCPECRAEIKSALNLRPQYRNGAPVIDVSIDPTDLEHHTLSAHVEKGAE